MLHDKHQVLPARLELASLIPRPPHPAFIAFNTKSRRKAWKDLSRDACHCWHLL